MMRELCDAAMAIWLRKNRRGEKLGVMSQEEIRAACRRMRR